MAEVAEAMANGEECEACGQYLDGKKPGYARYCSIECADSRGADHDQVVDEDDWADIDPHSGMPI